MQLLLLFGLVLKGAFASGTQRAGLLGVALSSDHRASRTSLWGRHIVASSYGERFLAILLAMFAAVRRGSVVGVAS